MGIELYSFPSLLRHIRRKAGLTQKQFAEILGVSTINISQFESGKREPSKKIIRNLADKLDITPFALMPFLDNKEIEDIENLSGFERLIYNAGTYLQKELIDKKIHLFTKQ